MKELKLNINGKLYTAKQAAKAVTANKITTDQVLEAWGKGWDNDVAMLANEQLVKNYNKFYPGLQPHPSEFYQIKEAL